MASRMLMSVVIAVILIILECGNGSAQPKQTTPAVQLQQARVVILSEVAQARFACVLGVMQSGTPSKEAIEDCLKKVPSFRVDAHRGAAGLGGGLPGVGGRESVPVSASCPASSTIDPKIAQPPGTRRPTAEERRFYKLGGGQYMYTDAERKRMADERAGATAESMDQLNKTDEFKEWQKALENADKVANDPKASDEAKKAAQEAVDNARKKMEGTREHQEAEKNLEKLNNIPVHTPPLTSRTDPNAQSACQDLAVFLAECNDNGWKRQDCQLFLQRLGRCGDPLVTDPRPDAALGGCRLPAVDPETARRAAVLACQKVTRPVPGTDPCIPMNVDAQLHTYALGHGKACSDPRAITDPEQCTPTVTLATFGRTLTQGDLDELRRKAGGPVIFLPGQTPGDPRPGGGPSPDPSKPR
jgi:hypothetical protein